MVPDGFSTEPGPEVGVAQHAAFGCGEHQPGGMGRQLRAVALSPFVRQRLTMKTPKEHYTDLERLARLIETGQLSPTIDKTYPLNQAPDAMRHLQAGQARGKLAIAVTQPSWPIKG
jgi:NADPH:quinone reductase-like Zn-dependent oxidoreductase